MTSKQKRQFRGDGITTCRNCGVWTTRSQQFFLRTCDDCWRAFFKGAATAVGAGLVTLITWWFKWK